MSLAKNKVHLLRNKILTVCCPCSKMVNISSDTKLKTVWHQLDLSFSQDKFSMMVSEWYEMCKIIATATAYFIVKYITLAYASPTPTHMSSSPQDLITPQLNFHIISSHLCLFPLLTWTVSWLKPVSLWSINCVWVHIFNLKGAATGRLAGIQNIHKINPNVTHAQIALWAIVR